MLGFIYAAMIASVQQAKAEQDMVNRNRQSMSPEDFEKWMADRTAERRHQEVCRAIRDAGTNARWRLF